MKKIMFDNHYGLEDAVLNGTKTMTRRIIKLYDDESLSCFIDGQGKLKVNRICKPDKRFDVRFIKEVKPRYQVGDVVAVAQRYTDIVWRTNPFISAIPDLSADGELYNSNGWRNKMYVRADLMPHRIEITDIKVERLQDITDEDCLREGIYYDEPFPELAEPDVWAFKVKGKKRSSTWWSPSPKVAFENLINCMSGKGTWDSNPWVFAYTFKLIK